MTINIEEFNIIKEGKASVLVPKQETVFYNHIQQFNRDLSVMAIRAWLAETNAKRHEKMSKKRKLEDETGGNEPIACEDRKFVRILEALSASGLRALRYGHEVPQVSRIVANDLLPAAVASINRSAEYNNLSDLVKGHEGDAITYMGSIKDNERFHVVDLDPYGTAAPFLESAVRSIMDDGLLMVTCTDAGVLAGNGYPEKCYALYGGSNFGNTFMGSEANHEAGIRLILSTIANVAARHKKCIEPVLSLSIDYYFRVFVRVKTSPAQVKQLASTMMLVNHCVGCGYQVEQRMGRVSGNKFQTPRASPVGPNCPCCGSPFHVAGPMWGGKLHNKEFVEKVLSINRAADTSVYGTTERIKGMLTLAKEEIETPFYTNLGRLPSLFKASTIPLTEFARALGNLGHRVSLTHAKANSIKTSAPWEDVLLLAARWLRKCNEKRLSELKASVEGITDEEKKQKKLQTIKELEENIDTSKNLSDTMPGARVLKFLEKDTREVDFDTPNELSDGLVKLRKIKMVRFQETPANWGPKARPGKKQKTEEKSVEQ
ncbi:RNA methyltransferase tRNA(m5U54)methyltransferase [Candidozyma auris]|uniref:tRNA (guanine(26)-N(2))-dimethyltransferase n=2 Tax=Candidozyma auris TaxID=498019 RepID=A0AB73SN47_CANAR|nr:N2,N2-dimethylguanosine tRNA methyltransferase [[Candida] auris]PSK78447.1 N2,N2-dimethylguanosine tRNA methyltransferase [[Candida] auris]QEL58578.1 N2,N2-dimethylguanosine tRNA methyltransferase [[Candida] auris]QWW21790.1 hypothetical protein CA7LBN_000536 [[Candida] auris]